MKEEYPGACVRGKERAHWYGCSTSLEDYGGEMAWLN